jgi:guanylate kinase
MNLKKMYPDHSLSIFIMPPSLGELEKRLRIRSTESEENLKKRLEKAGQEITFSKNFDLVVVNDILENAVMEVIQAVRQFTGA